MDETITIMRQTYSALLLGNGKGIDFVRDHARIALLWAGSLSFFLPLGGVIIFRRLMIAYGSPLGQEDVYALLAICCVCCMACSVTAYRNAYYEALWMLPQHMHEVAQHQPTAPQTTVSRYGYPVKMRDGNEVVTSFTHEQRRAIYRVAQTPPNVGCVARDRLQPLWVGRFNYDDVRRELELHGLADTTQEPPRLTEKGIEWGSRQGEKSEKP